MIFISTLLFAVRLFLKAVRAEISGRTKLNALSPAGRLARAVLASYFLFLVYAFARAASSDVYVDAERNFLLFLTPLLIGLQVIFSFSARQNRTLSGVITLNLLLLGIYGIINYIFFSNRYTMWVPVEPQYQVNGIIRATGSYVCPDHFSGIMELTLCIGLALALTRASSRRARAAGLLLSATASAGIFFSKSRGGGLTAAVIMMAVLAFGLFTWDRKKGNAIRLCIFAGMLAVLASLSLIENPYSKRFASYFGSGHTKKSTWAGTVHSIKSQLMNNARGNMFSAGYRAWRTAPLFGIGAGMHQNLWPHFAASGDGSREETIWPTRLNNKWYSYQTHNDWLQLLEEYGLFGFILFFVPFLLLTGLYLRLTRSPLAYFEEITLTTALLALIAMAFHSLGDFNLQMPATVWMFAVMIFLPLRHAIYPSVEEKDRT